MLRGGEEAMGSINRILGDADLCSDPGHLFFQPNEFFRHIECGARLAVVSMAPAAGTQLCSLTLLVFHQVKFPLPY